MNTVRALCALCGLLYPYPSLNGQFNQNDLKLTDDMTSTKQNKTKPCA